MIHRSIKESLGFGPDISDEEFLEKWNKLTVNTRKPCWDLKYCPYGILVEQFPLLPAKREAAEEHYEYLLSCLENNTLGVWPDVKPMSNKIRKFFKNSVRIFDPDDYPEETPKEIYKWSCQIFGHICPVVTSAENVAEKPGD